MSLDKRALGNSQPFNAYQDLLKVVSKFLRNFFFGRKNLQKIPWSQRTVYQEVDCYAIFAKSTFSNIHKWDKCNLSTLNITTISRRQVKDPKDTYLPKASNFSTYILKSHNAFFQDLYPRSCLLSPRVCCFQGVIHLYNLRY